MASTRSDEGGRPGMDWLFNPETWIALVTLSALEIVLGVDNVIFVSVLASKLPRAQQARARRLGLLGAMISRILLLFSLAWLARLTSPLFSIVGHDFSGRDLILVAGGLFLLAKATWEIHDNLEGGEHADAEKTVASFGSLIAQIMVLDIVFSLDSVITAIGMARQVGVMVAAVGLAVGVMLWASGPIASFVDRHPTVKILALSFLLLIGFSLVAEGFEQHIPKGYVYFAMGFSVFVEMLNLRVRRVTEPVQLQRRMPEK
jgi:predicted tellurium resistance membrane protein TerC